jgi:MarR family transcriptional regulator, temperature-dependent positive regulator of motility
MLGADLQRVLQRIEAGYAEKLSDAEIDLTSRQFLVMKACASADSPSQTDLVNQTGIDRSTLADIVRRLVKRGLLQRRRTKEDARTYAVNLTDAGRSLLARCAKFLDAVDRDLTRDREMQDLQRAAVAILDRWAQVEKEAA